MLIFIFFFPKGGRDFSISKPSETIGFVRCEQRVDRKRRRVHRRELHLLGAQ